MIERFWKKPLCSGHLTRTFHESRLLLVAMSPQDSKPSPDQPHRRRPRYSGTHPRKFEHRYKEFAPERYPEIVDEVRDRGGTLAGTHVPVLVEEIMAALQPAAGQLVADCTLGYGGHTEAFLKRIEPDGRVFAFDVDAREMEKTRQRLASYGERVHYYRRNFAGIPKVLSEAHIDGFDIILADLGVSSMQVDNPRRGFSYKFDGPLDMRMDDRIPKNAADLLMTLSEREIADALENLADEPDHRAIARLIVKNRADRPIRKTSHLKQIIFEAKGITQKQWREQANNRQGTLHPAARTFQAFRILVNDELGSLRQLLRVAPFCLRPGGRLGIITFHGGEDQIVEKVFQEGLAAGYFSAVCAEPIRPNSTERFHNPRSASARFRWAHR